MPEKEELMRIRGLIAGDLEGFARVIKETSFVQYFGEVRGEKNKRIDMVWGAAAAEQPLIFNKQFYIQHSVEAEDTLRLDFDDYVVEVWQASRGFNSFLQKDS
jgi:hypothetical protein